MSSVNENLSGAGELPSPQSGSILDFFYHDSRRIASFLAQFEELGHLSQITKHDGVSEVEGQETGTEGTGGLPGVASGKLANKSSVGSSFNESVQRVYDPFWANARRFLDLLNERGMIARDVNDAAIGQIVLTKGKLIVADLSAYKDLWKSDVVRRYIGQLAQQNEEGAEAANRQQRRSNKGGPKDKPIGEMDIVMEMLPYLPHSPQIHILTDTTAVWGTVEESHLSASFSDLLLKHGSKVAGEWSALGILDGRPWESDDLVSAAETIQMGNIGTSFMALPLNMAPHVRLMMGRPLNSFGITPLLIFREVN